MAAVAGQDAGGRWRFDRVSALILLMPVTYKPPTQADSAPPMPAWVESTMMRLLGSDFLFWTALHIARDRVIKVVLATPLELLTTASPQQQARVNAMLDHILPVSIRAGGLRSDTAVGTHLAPAPLASIHVPTLIVSARDDRYGTCASAAYAAGEIAGAKFIGFEQGGNTWVGHDDEVMSAVIQRLATEVAKQLVLDRCTTLRCTSADLAQRHPVRLQLRLAGVGIAMVEEAVVARVRAEDLAGVLDRAEVLLGAREDLGRVAHQAIAVCSWARA